MFSLDQYAALRERAGIVDRTARGQIGLTGRDRASFLHGLLTNDILALEPGTGCYAAHLTAQGRMISDMRVLELGDRILLDVPAPMTELLLQRLDQFLISEKVEVTNLTKLVAGLGVHGPSAADVVSAATGGALRPEELAAFTEYQNRVIEFDADSLVVVRDEELGVPGFNLNIERAKAERLTNAVRAAGAVDVDSETAEVLRVEAGRPLFGADMDETVIPLEAGIEKRAISFTKGCYVGQEIIIRILHRGHGRVARRLVGLIVRADEAPSAGDAIARGEKPVGHVTSAVRSPSIGGPIALGYVHRDFTAAGSEVTILHGSSTLPAVVSDLPFVMPRR